ncbi:MAG TPA: Glu/Leu/Phe/Val dehydrogenase dimerization domain-containing protein [Acidimicrobiales bacterium]|nr:Glu/Leu/Phe/Val dehydrogenase dimerization domain-containing protein [Acidimicrobiales bacterium]
MQLTKLDRNAAFVIRDLPDVPCEGPVRLGPKVTQANAKLYARVATYRLALLGIRRGGGAAGIKAEAADGSTAVADFVEDVRPLVARGDLALDPAAGVSAEGLAPLRDDDPRNPLLWESVDGGAVRELAAARSAAACAEAYLGGLDGQRVALRWSRAAAPLAQELHRRGARIVAISTGAGSAVQEAGFGVDELVAAAADHGDDLVTHLGVDTTDQWAVFGVDVDVFVPAPTLRSLSEEGAGMVRAGVVLPSGEQPVSPKALASLRRRGVAALPDTIALAGPSIVGAAPTDASIDDALARVDTAVAEAMAASAHDDGPLLGSCYAAESFLRTWRDELPFGRPLP